MGIITIAGVFLLYGHKQPSPLRDSKGDVISGSISEKVFVDINGHSMGMFITGKNVNNPVVLYLHGGMPSYFLTKKYPTGLEDYFTVVWWDQRGCGLSFSSNDYKSDDSDKAIYTDLMISDTEEVAKYLINRFGKEKIYLMGHSGGSFLGILTAAKSPELFHAYIGVAQMSRQYESERLAYEFMVEKYEELGNSQMANNLRKSPITETSGIPYEYLKLRDKAMHTLGIGTTHDMRSVITGVFFTSLTNRDYTIREKINMWRGKAKSGVSSMWSDMMKRDLSKEVTKFEIPIYLFHGIHDYTVSYKLAKEYFDLIDAPKKAFYTFENSAHSPIFEEPGKVREIIFNEVLPE